MVQIETDRLTIRRMQDRDLRNFLEYESHPDHCRYLSRGPYTDDQARDFIAVARDLPLGAEGQYHHLSIELRSTAKMIGSVCVKVVSQAHRQGDVGWFLHPGYQGQGLATEASRALLEFAFTKLDLHRITAHCDAQNTRSRLMMERLGMRREGFYRQIAYFDEVWHDQYSYAILAAEWTRAESSPQ